jgi:hypothetical protein
MEKYIIVKEKSLVPVSIEEDFIGIVNYLNNNYKTHYSFCGESGWIYKKNNKNNITLKDALREHGLIYYKLNDLLKEKSIDKKIKHISINGEKLDLLTADDECLYIDLRH